jgi:hypothetical protein
VDVFHSPHNGPVNLLVRSNMPVNDTADTFELDALTEGIERRAAAQHLSLKLPLFIEDVSLNNDFDKHFAQEKEFWVSGVILLLLPVHTCSHACTVSAAAAVRIARHDSLALHCGDMRGSARLARLKWGISETGRSVRRALRPRARFLWQSADSCCSPTPATGSGKLTSCRHVCNSCEHICLHHGRMGDLPVRILRQLLTPHTPATPRGECAHASQSLRYTMLV